jgi:PD-(D/E)XK nuclease superfamily protein
MGLRQNKLLQADDSGQISRRGIQEHEAWAAARAAAIAAGSAPTLKVAVVTELARAPGATAAEAIAIEEMARDPKRPHGVRFGTLVHLAMLRVGFDADADRIRAVVAGAGRIAGASDEEIAAAQAAIAAALKSPLIRRAAAAERVMRECPLMVTLEDGTTAEGIADLAFAEQHGGALSWTVVDFKTDVDIAPRLDEYRAQIGLYVRAVRAATGRPASGAILWI